MLCFIIAKGWAWASPGTQKLITSPPAPVKAKGTANPEHFLVWRRFIC
jgi:hypothetical protein